MTNKRNDTCIVSSIAFCTSASVTTFGRIGAFFGISSTIFTLTRGDVIVATAGEMLTSGVPLVGGGTLNGVDNEGGGKFVCVIDGGGTVKFPFTADVGNGDEVNTFNCGVVTTGDAIEERLLEPACEGLMVRGEKMGAGTADEPSDIMGDVSGGFEIVLSDVEVPGTIVSDIVVFEVATDWDSFSGIGAEAESGCDFEIDGELVELV